MARNFQVNGEALVYVKFGAQIRSGHAAVSGVSAMMDSIQYLYLNSGNSLATQLQDGILIPTIPGNFYATITNPSIYELGLSLDPIVITPKYHHHDVKVDDYGTEVPAEVMSNLSEVFISMRLVHYDHQVMLACLGESIGGYNGVDGTLPPAGTIMGGGQVVPYSSGSHYMSLNIYSLDVGNRNWNFPSSYLAQQPVELPVGTRNSEAVLTWRAIPAHTYPITEPRSVNKTLWTHSLDYV